MSPCVLLVGLKPGQRKVLFTCFKRKLFKELKVAQLAGSVAEISAYHHGEVSTVTYLSQIIMFCCCWKQPPCVTLHSLQLTEGNHTGGTLFLREKKE